MSTYASDALYKKVETALNDKSNYNLYKNTIDQHMANNFDKYSAIGPIKRPIFRTEESDLMFQSMGLTKDDLTGTINLLKSKDSRWKIRGVDQPVNLAVVLSLRYFLVKNDEKQIKNALSYMICFNYPLFHYKYFRKAEPTESIMSYTINNLSNKYQIKVVGNVWAVLYDTTDKAFQLQKNGIKKGDDDAFVRFIADVRTRINGFMQKIANAYYANWKSGNYLQNEHESFDEDKYYEADSNTLAIERITNKVLTRLIVSGPNSKLVELAAKNCSAPVNALRTYTATMITDKQKDDIRTIIERLLFLYLLTENEDNKHSIRDVGTNDFLIYCMKVYKKSNTIDPNVIKIKEILDRWLRELGEIKSTAQSKSSRANNMRRALYMFFVMSIMENS